MKIKQKHHVPYMIKITEHYDSIENPKGNYTKKNTFWIIDIHDRCALTNTAKRCDNKQEVMKLLKQELILAKR